MDIKNVRTKQNKKITEENNVAGLIYKPRIALVKKKKMKEKPT